MIEEEGIVMEVRDGSAKVSILAKNACEKCASAGVCHPEGEGSFMEASNPLGAKQGQKVKVIVAPQLFLKASIILYGIPMAVFVAAAIMGKNVGSAYAGEAQSDLWAFLSGMFFMLVSFLFIKRYNRKVEKTQEYKPVIVEILG